MPTNVRTESLHEIPAAPAGLLRKTRRLGRVTLISLPGAFAAAVLVALVAGLAAAGPAFAGLLATGIVLERQSRWAPLLRFLGGALWALRPAAAAVVLSAVWAAGAHGLSAVVVAVGAALAALPGMIVAHRARRLVRRIGVVGTPEAAARLQRELDAHPGAGYTVAISVIPPTWGPWAMETPVPVASVTALPDVVAQQGIELLVITGGDHDGHRAKALAARTNIAVIDLAAFHERVFGAVPVAEVHDHWLSGVGAGPASRTSRVVKRALDLAVGVPMVLVALPIIAVFSILIRRDGGPALFRQERVGRGGRTITVYKLRTMTVAQPGATSVWTTADDSRITPLGAFLRKTHLDELPQLLSIVGGSMSLVGPRPEQVGYAAELEQAIPHYARRHDVKPGLTGWAQVRCGYAGSLEGSAYKLCNDLFYLKHSSLSLDLAILFETFRTLVADEQFGAAPATAETMLGTGERRILAKAEAVAA